MADETPAKSNSTVQGLIALLVLAGLIWFYFGGGLEMQTASTMADIEKKVAADSVAQYNIAARSGTPMDKCVHAGLVAAAYLQAKDEPNYKTWKSREDADCRAAGVPR
jgi:hypothetical protein